MSEPFFDVLQAVAAAYGATYLVTAAAAPRWFITTISFERIMSIGRDRRSSYFDDLPWWGMPIGFLVMICVGVVVYHAIGPIFELIPDDWGGLDEDGEWQSTREHFQIYATCLLTVLAVSTAENSAKSRITDEPPEK